MNSAARERSPDTLFHTADICEWEPERQYDFISAWDSTFHGQEFGYSTLGVNEFVRVLEAGGLTCVHVEYDQHPEPHVFIVGVKN